MGLPSRVMATGPNKVNESMMFRSRGRVSLWIADSIIVTRIRSSRGLWKRKGSANIHARSRFLPAFSFDRSRNRFGSVLEAFSSYDRTIMQIRGSL
jgi:hypothetical protein